MISKKQTHMPMAPSNENETSLMAPPECTAKLSIYTEQQTAALTDSSSICKGMESDFNEFCNLQDEWVDEQDEGGNDQVIPRIISASVVKTKDKPLGITISNNSDSSTAVVSSISCASPFHTNNYAHSQQPISEGDEILTINGHRVKDARRAAEMIRATEEGTLTVVVSTALIGSDEGGKKRARRRIDGSAYHMIRLSTYVAPSLGGAASSCSFRGMELQIVNDQASTTSLVRIKCIQPSSVFAKSGLRRGDIILTIDGCIVRTVEDAIRVLERDQGTDDINRVVSLLVYSLWDMRSRVITDELMGSSPQSWGIALSCEDKQGENDAEKECITLTMSDTTVSFELIFEPDGTCSCPEPLAALKSFPQAQEVDRSRTSSAGSDSECIMYSRNEARSALELLFHRHIKQVVDAINYHSWRQFRLMTHAMDEADEVSKGYHLVSPFAPTTATHSLASSCPSPKTRSLMIFSDLEKAMAPPPQRHGNHLYSANESSAQEKLDVSNRVLHSTTNLMQGIPEDSLQKLESSKAHPSPRVVTMSPAHDAEVSPTLPNFNNEPPTPSAMVISVPRAEYGSRRPKYIPPVHAGDDSSESSSSSDESSSSEDTPPRRRRQRKASPNKKITTPVCTELVVHQGDAAPRAKRTPKQPMKDKKASKPQHLVTSSDPLANIRQGQIRAHYKVSAEVVGIGAFGAVRYCTHRKTKKEFAVKSIPQNVAVKNTELLRNEVSILRQVKHKNVVRLVDLMQDDRFIHIIMEKCQGGDLFDKIIKDGISFSEKMVSQIIGNILDAIDYLHERNICHRDLKAEHIMMKTNGHRTTVKIIDFGLAVVHNPDVDPPLTAFAGSAFTVAPEVIQRQYSKEVDLWAVGVISYFVLTHQMPFNAHSNEEMFKKIQFGVFYYPKWAKDGISDDAKDFLERLLVVNPKERMTAKQALSHPWIRKFHLSSSQSDLALAVVLYDDKNVSSKTKKTARIRNEAQKESQALVLYDENARNKPTQRHRRSEQAERDPNRYKSARPHNNVNESHGKERSRLKKEAEGEKYLHRRHSTIKQKQHHVSDEARAARRRR